MLWNAVFVDQTMRLQQIHKVIESLAQLPNGNSALHLPRQSDPLLQELQRRIVNRVQLPLLIDKAGCEVFAPTLPNHVLFLFQVSDLHGVPLQVVYKCRTRDRIHPIVSVEGDAYQHVTHHLLLSLLSNDVSEVPDRPFEIVT